MIRVGRRFDPHRGTLGLLPRWYAAQPTQRIVAAVLERDAPVTREALESALRTVHDRHGTSLGVCVERSTKRLSLRPASPGDPLPIDVRHEDDARKIAAELVHVPFAVGAPLYRATLARGGHEIVFGLDHIAFDGRSAAILACDVARALGGLPLDALAPDDGAPLDARMDLRPAPRHVLRALRSAPFSPPLPTIHGTLRTGMRWCVLDRARVASLRARARDHAVSLHGLLSAAALRATTHALDRERARLRLHTPVSLRDRCAPEPMGLGVFIAGLDGDFEASRGGELGPLAREIRDHLARERPHAPGNVGLLALAGDLARRAASLDARANGRTASVEVSNVGRAQGVPAGTRLWLTQGAHYHAALFVLTIVETDAVRVCLSFPEPLVSAARADAFIASFDAALA